MQANSFRDTDEYISAFPENVQELLRQIHNTIKASAPEAEERISYGMPTFFYKKMPLVYFAAFQNHIGLYALPSGNNAFQDELAEYKTGKGSIQFPLDKPMPLDLIKRIVKFRLQENLEKSEKKSGKA